MQRSHEAGSINTLLIPLIMVSVFLVGAAAAGAWAFMSRQDYKNNVDTKIAAAVEVAKSQTATAKDNEFIDREKLPLKQYRGSDEFGAVTISYPKTWSAYINESGQSDTPIDAYFYPNFVPALQQSTSFALRLQVSNQPFSSELAAFDSFIKSGTATAKPYKPSNVPGVVGEQITGQIGSAKQGIMILVPLRDKTIKIWTEAEQFKGDFVKNVLPHFSFTP